MPKFLKTALTLFFLFLLFTVHYAHFTGAVFAEGEFETSYKVRYDIQDTGKTRVTQNIVLKNKTTNYYADKFELKIGSTKVEDVKAQDTAGALETEVKFENNVTTIGVKFNQKVIGVDKTLPWTLTYSSNETCQPFRSNMGNFNTTPRKIRRNCRLQCNRFYTSRFWPIAFAVPTR